MPARIFEVDACERLFDVQIAGLAAFVDAIPVEHAISRIRVLLHFKNHEARANGMHAAAGQEHRVARFHRHTMETIFDLA